MLTMPGMSKHNDESPFKVTADRSDPVAVLTEALARGERVDRALAEAGIPLSSTGSATDVGDPRFRLSDHMQQVLSPAQLTELRDGEEAGDIIGALRGIRRI
jgi:hypothetical protein